MRKINSLHLLSDLGLYNNIDGESEMRVMLFMFMWITLTTIITCVFTTVLYVDMLVLLILNNFSGKIYDSKVTEAHLMVIQTHYLDFSCLK